MGKLKKTLKIVSITIVIFFLLIIFFISPIAKYLVEKYDVKYTNREIKMDWAYVNPLTGYIHFDDLTIYEYKSDSIFFSAKGFSANISIFKLFFGTYDFSEITLNKPKGNVIQYKNDFNFTDLAVKFTTDEDEKEEKKTVRFNLLNIEVIDGEFHYKEDKSSVNYFIKDVDIQSKGLRYDVDSLVVDISFLSGPGSGKVGGQFMVNVDNLDYRIVAKVDNLELDLLTQYFKDLSNFGTFSAVLDGDMTSHGNFGEVDSLSLAGYFTLSDFHFGKTKDIDYASFEDFTISINEVSLKDKIYHYDSIVLNKPFFNYELYDYLDNIQTMFGEKGGNVTAINADDTEFNLVITIAKLVWDVSKDFMRSQYKLDKLRIYDGNIEFNDYTVDEKFTIAVNPINIRANDINKKSDLVKLNVKSGIKPYGEVDFVLSVDPKDSTFFDLDYHFQKIPLTMFNPYITHYTSFPLDRGVLDISGHWNVRNKNISSNNHLTIVDPRISKRIKTKDTDWIPVPFAMYFIRDRNNVIDYEIPITGSLDDPNFKLKDVIFNSLKNIFIKPSTTLYGVQVKYVEQHLEKALAMKWEFNNNKPTMDQKKFLSKMARFLEDNPNAQINISPNLYSSKEKESILLFEAKKKCFLASENKSNQSFTKNDSIFVVNMSIRDTKFLKYLNKKVSDPLLFTVQHKAEKMVSQSFVNKRFQELSDRRKIAFMSIFKEKGVQKQIRFTEGINKVPFNGFSFYSISYKNEYPDYLIKSYKKMNAINSEPKREKYHKTK